MRQNGVTYTRYHYFQVKHNKEKQMFQNAELTAQMDRLGKFAYKLTNSKHDAEDLLHSTIVRAIEKKHLFKEGTNLYSWTSKMMYNLFVSGYRRKVKFESQYDPEPYIEKQSMDASQDTKIALQEVDHAMDLISEEHNEIINLVCVEGKQYSEVSEQLDIPVGTVRSRLSRARDSLQKTLISQSANQNNGQYNDLRMSA